VLGRKKSLKGIRNGKEWESKRGRKRQTLNGGGRSSKKKRAKGSIGGKEGSEALRRKAHLYPRGRVKKGHLPASSRHDLEEGGGLDEINGTEKGGSGKSGTVCTKPFYGGRKRGTGEAGDKGGTRCGE